MLIFIFLRWWCKIILPFDFMFIEGHKFISFIITLINNRRLFNYDNRRIESYESS